VHVHDSHTAAGLKITKVAAGSLDATTILAGNSVIENEATKTVDEDCLLSRGDDQKNVVFNSLSIAGSLVRAGPNATLRGSVAMNGIATVNDDSMTSEAIAKIIQVTEASASAVCTKPAYGN